MKIYIAIAVLLLAGGFSHADGLFLGDLGYSVTGIDNASSNSLTNRLLMNLDIGYTGAQTGFTAVAEYALEKVDTTSSGADPVEGNRTSYGFGLGWISPQAMGPYALASYFPYSQYVEASTTYQGWGAQMDGGLKTDLGRAFILMGVSYSYFEYYKQLSGSIASTVHHQNLAPRLGVELTF